MYCRMGTVRLSHTDAAGVIFFPRLLEMAHEGWEDYLDEAGFPLSQGIAGPGPLFPIVHCEADYLRPMRLGDTFRHELSVERVGTSSCTLRHSFRSPAGQELARALTVHAAMDRATGASQPLPERVRELLDKLGGPAEAESAGA